MKAPIASQAFQEEAASKAALVEQGRRGPVTEYSLRPKKTIVLPFTSFRKCSPIYCRSRGVDMSLTQAIPPHNSAQMPQNPAQDVWHEMCCCHCRCLSLTTLRLQGCSSWMVKRSQNLSRSYREFSLSLGVLIRGTTFYRDSLMTCWSLQVLQEFYDHRGT